MEKYLIDINTTLQKINSNLLHTPLLSDYQFLISLANLIILLFTLYWLIKYTKATQQMKDQVVKQNELRQMPVLVLYIRKISDIDDVNKRNQFMNEFAISKEVDEPERIVPSEFYISLRNIGEGAAFKVDVESDNFIVEKFKTKIFAPLKDEHPIKIVKKGENGKGQKIRDPFIVNGAIFKITCYSFINETYHYSYKIVDLEKGEVEYMF